MKTPARILHGQIVFRSPVTRARFFEKTEGKNVFIEVDDSPTGEMRRYFEGCLVPTVFYTNPRSGWATFRDARDAIKLEFLPSRPVSSLRGVLKARGVPSTADLTKDSFRRLIEAIRAWLLENSLCVEDDIDHDNYKRWRDSAPAADEIYPPLRRLKERYDTERTKAFPWRNDLPKRKNK